MAITPFSCRPRYPAGVRAAALPGRRPGLLSFHSTATGLTAASCRWDDPALIPVTAWWGVNEDRSLLAMLVTTAVTHAAGRPDHPIGPMQRPGPRGRMKR